MPRPDGTPGQEHPLWDPPDADTGDGSLAPLVGKRTTGWVPGEKPPSQWFNWFWRSVSRWLSWFDTATVQGEDLEADGARVRYDTDEGPGYGQTFSMLAAASSPRYANVQGATLYLREEGIDAPANRFAVVLPPGWDAAASGDAVVRVPPQAEVASFGPAVEVAIAEPGTWTPTLVGVYGATETPEGWYQRTGNLVTALFDLQWTGGSASGTLEIDGLPYPIVGTARGFAVPTIAMVGTARDLVTGALPLVGLPGAGTSFVLFTGPTPLAAYTPGHLVGSLTYVTG